MNLLNYLGRFVPSAVKELFKADLHLTDAQTSYPFTAYVIIYMLACPLFGTLADRWPRKVVIAGGVLVWSLATGAAAWAVGFWSFLAARALVGVGEAAYATLSPALLSDLYPPERRNRVLTIFYVAIPVGAALGFVLGGAVGAHWGWRSAFWVAGLPGLLAAAIVLGVQEPTRGQFDLDRTSVLPWRDALAALRHNREYLIAVAGYTAVTFASGALADWFPTFLVRHRGMSLASAGSLVGASTVVGGLGGTLLGGLLGDRLRKRTQHPYLALCALSMLPAALLAGVALLSRDPLAIALSLVTAQLFFWCYNGPVNTVLVNCVGSGLRTRAFSLSLLCIHLFGDAISPSVVGRIADASSLPIGMALVPISMVLGASIWGYGWRTLPASA